MLSLLTWWMLGCLFTAFSSAVLVVLLNVGWEIDIIIELFIEKHPKICQGIKYLSLIMICGALYALILYICFGCT